MTRRYRFIGSLLVVVALLCVMQLGGCTLVTTFTEYRISETSHDAPHGVRVHIHFSPARHVSMRIPGLYDTERYSDPYQCHFTIWGEFDEVATVEALMKINDHPTTRVPVDIAQLNRNRKLSQEARSYFPAGQIPFVASAAEIQTIVVTTSFTAVAKGRATRYVITNKYEMSVYTETGNRWWFAMMSV